MKGYFAGEAAGIRLANRESKFACFRYGVCATSSSSGVDKLATLPPETAPPTEIQALKYKLLNTLEEIRDKNKIREEIR